MNNLYRFSPIESEDSFRKALNYLTIELERLSQELLNKAFVFCREMIWILQLSDSERWGKFMTVY
jgi:hypothetical protein